MCQTVVVQEYLRYPKYYVDYAEKNIPTDNQTIQPWSILLLFLNNVVHAAGAKVGDLMDTCSCPETTAIIVALPLTPSTPLSSHHEQKERVFQIYYVVYIVNELTN